MHPTAERAEDKTTPPVEDADVVVVGSGAAGLSAAIRATFLGLKVVVLEKTDCVGGTSAYSGGAAWVPGNDHMTGAGITDTTDKAKQYVTAIVGDSLNEPMVDAFLESCPEAFRFLEKHTSSVRFQSPGMVDYFPSLPGATSHRTLMPVVFDAAAMGRSFKYLRPQLQQFMMLHSMQFEAADVVKMQAGFKSPKAFIFSASLFIKYAVSRVLHGRGTRLVRGNALMGRMYKSALDMGIDIRRGAAVVRLLSDDRRVNGVVYSAGGRETELRARMGVVLACGGWSANKERRSELMPYAAQHVSMLPEGNVGDGIEMALQRGARFGEAKASNGILAPVSVRRTADGTTVKYPFFSFERGKPGMMIVDKHGKRFTNDADCYHDVVKAMQAQGVVPAYLVADSATLRKYGMGLARAAPYRPEPLIRDGHLFAAATLRELALKVGISPDGLEATAARMNSFQATGTDEDFGRGGNSYNRSTGDANHRPNPCLGPVSRPPFYAVKLYPGDVGTTCGLQINTDAQVLDMSGEAIEGLYACGLDADSIFTGYYPGAGSMHGPNITFGYRAANHMERQSKSGDAHRVEETVSRNASTAPVPSLYTLMLW